MNRHQHHMSPAASDALAGVASTALTAVAVITSFQQEVEWWLRVLSLLAGIGVAGMTMWSLWKKRQRSD